MNKLVQVYVERRYYIQCPDCDEFLYINQDEFDAKDGGKGFKKCDDCGVEIEYNADPEYLMDGGNSQ